MSETFELVVVSGGTSDPPRPSCWPTGSRSGSPEIAGRRGAAVRTRVVELRELATDVTTALTSQLITPKLQQAIDALGAADAVIAASPVYKAGRAVCSPRSSTCSTTIC